MSLEIIPYQPEHALEIISRQTMQPCLEISEQVEQWSVEKKKRGPAITAIWNESLVGCGGLEIFWPGFAEAWMVLAKEVSGYRVETRLRFISVIRDALDLWTKEHDLIRIQAPLRADFPLGLRFAKAIGFEYEGTLRKYHPDRVDALMHSIITRR